jgi:hypothetical protein
MTPSNSPAAGLSNRASLPTYRTYDVRYEHRTALSDTVKQDRAIVTVYGNGELALKQAIEQQRPGHTAIVILEARSTGR